MDVQSKKAASGSVFRLLILLLLSIFIAEAVIMSALEPLRDQNWNLAVLVDSTLLTLTLFPFLYFAVFKKLAQKNDALAAARDELAAAYDDLEGQVEQRTREIEQARRALEETSERFANIAESASDWMWEMDADLRFSFLSARFFEIFPIPPEDIIGKTREIFASVDTHDARWRQHHEDLINRRPFRDFAYTTIQADGRQRHIAINGKPVFDADGAFKGYRGTGTDKTAEVEAQRAVEESEKQFRNLVEGSIQGVFVHQDWHILFANQALADMFGYRGPDEINALEPLIAPEERERLAGYREARKKSEYAPEIYEAWGLKQDGTKIFLEFRVTQIDWRGTAAVQTVVIDITERKQAEEALKRQNQELRKRDRELNEQNERFNAALENMSQGLVMFDAEQRLVVCNARFVSMYDERPEQLEPGTTLREILQRRVSSGVYPEADSDAFIERLVSEASRGAGGKRIRYLGDGRIIEITHHPMSGGGWLSTHEDITERIRAEEALRESEELFSKAFHASPVPFAISDPADGTHYDVNEAWMAVLGYTREEALAHTSIELGIWVDPDKRAQFVERLMKDGSVRDFEAKYKTKSDGERDFLVSGEYVDIGGEPRLFVVCHDVTALKKAERTLKKQNAELRRRDIELKEQNERFNTALSNMSQGLSMFDGESRLIVCNELYATIYGLTPEQVKPGTPLCEIVKHRIEKGVYGNAVFEEVIKQQQARIASDKPYSNVKHLSDGRVVQTYHQPMSGGGWIGTHEDITERIRAEEALRESEELFSKAFHASPVPFAISDPGDGAHYDVNEAWMAVLGYTREEALARTALELGLWADSAQRAQCVDMLRTNGSVRNFNAKFRTKSGEERDFFISGEYVQVGGTPRQLMVCQDITALKKAERALREQNDRFNAALSNMSQGLCMFDREQRLVVCNERYALIYDLSPDLLKPGTLFRDILEYRIAAGVYAGDDPEEYIRERCEAVIDRESSAKIQELTDGRIIAIAHQPLADGGWLATHEDITDYRRIEQRLAFLAHHDALTGLANRVLLRERLEESLKRTSRPRGFALLYIDLDGFKGINDTLGHSAGDALLQTIGGRLTSCIAETDMVARLGGDEFAIIQQRAKHSSDATTLAERIRHAISAPVNLGYHEVVVGASIGIAFAPKDGADPEQLLRNADLALYHAKNASRGAYCLFEPAMETSTKDRHALGLDLRKALAGDAFELYYQPLFNLKMHKISGFEALLRWHHPQRGMVSPADFIPIAEETGLIGELGAWVLHQACGEAAGWPEEIKVAVNVSPVQFKRGNLVDVVKGALRATGLGAHRLELEVTESVLLQNDKATLAMLHQLQEIGVRISMDDFGTGYSSLSYLQSFPFDKIKIDASFVRDLSGGDDDIGIVQAVVRLASRLGVATTAEGVETHEQLQIVTAEGCTEAQGYFFSRPMPAKDIARLVPRLEKKLASAAA